MTSEEVLDALVQLAGEAGLDVRVLSGRGDAEIPMRSGVCRVRDSLWVVLAAADPMEEKIAIVADALHVHASKFLEGRFLPPALRERLDRAAGKA